MLHWKFFPPSFERVNLKKDTETLLVIVGYCFWRCGRQKVPTRVASIKHFLQRATIYLTWKINHTKECWGFCAHVIRWRNKNLENLMTWPHISYVYFACLSNNVVQRGYESLIIFTSLFPRPLLVISSHATAVVDIALKPFYPTFFIFPRGTRKFKTQVWHLIRLQHAVFKVSPLNKACSAAL